MMTNLEPDDVIGSRIRDLRKRSGLSADQLASRCAGVGYPQLSATAIYLIEGGGRGKSGSRPRRRVTIEELLVLAVALETSPLVLLVPEDSDAEYAVTPELTTTTKRVIAWVLGNSWTPEGPPHEVADQGSARERARRFDMNMPGWMHDMLGQMRSVTHEAIKGEVREAVREALDTAGWIIPEAVAASPEREDLITVFRHDLERLGVAVESVDKKGGENGEPADQTDSDR